MPAKNVFRVAEKDIYAHIYNKGVEDRVIFNDIEDYNFFITSISEYLSAPTDPESKKKAFTVKGRTFRGTPHQPKNYFGRVGLMAYSLMPNHFHLILHQKEAKSIQSFIRSLCTRYSMYYNKKYHRTGSLFEGPYKSAQIKDMDSLLHLSAFIHHKSKYSTVPEYSGERNTPWIATESILSSFKNIDGTYRNFVENYQIGPKEGRLLDGILLEKATSHCSPDIPPTLVLEPAKSSRPQQIEIQSSTAWVPQYMGVAGVFLLLLALGLRNINAQSSENSSLQTSSTSVNALLESTGLQPQVLSVSSELSSPRQIIVRSGEGSEIVNIRKNAAIDAEAITEASDGDLYDLVSINSEWYEVKLPNGSTGFISTTQAELSAEYKN